jgi:hypothetical protein
VLMLPYFEFEDDSASAGDRQLRTRSKELMLRTDAALRYYQMKSQDIFDTAYLLGTPELTKVKYDDNGGGGNQKNPPLFLEIYAALAVKDSLLNQPSQQKAVALISLEQQNAVTWDDIPDSGNVKKKLVNNTIFALIWLVMVAPELNKVSVEKSIRSPWISRFFRSTDLIRAEKDRGDINKISKWCEAYWTWLVNIYDSSGRSVKLFEPIIQALRLKGELNQDLKLLEEKLQEIYGIKLGQVQSKLASHKVRPSDDQCTEELAKALYIFCEPVYVSSASTAEKEERNKDCFLLSALTNNPTDLKRHGEWNKVESIAFTDIAEKLKIDPPDRQVRTVSSIPDMWARPLLMQMALSGSQRQNKHPLHDEMKAQWQGMLAAIALAKVKSLNLRVKLVELSEENSDSFEQAVWKLIPSAKDTHYELEKKKNPWSKIYVFLLNGEAVGMTSPSTIVCPAEDGEWTGVEWWSEARKCLESPVNYLDEYEAKQLYLWLKHLQKQIHNQRQGNAPKLEELIIEFQKELKVKLGNQALDEKAQPSLDKGQEKYFGQNIILGNLTALDTPIQPSQSLKSSILLNPDRKAAGLARLHIIPNTDIAQQWGVRLQDICTDQKKKVTLNACNIEDYRSQDEYLIYDEIFDEEFYFIQPAQLLTGALLIQGKAITYNDEDGNEQSLTPLLPINPKLLTAITPGELIERIKVERLDRQDPKVLFTLKLPLSGNSSEDYQVKKEYSLKKQNAVTKIPILEVWPNFQAKGWNEYYGFYGDRVRPSEENGKTFHVKFSQSTPETQDIKDGASLYQIIQLQAFPSYVVCQDQTKSKDCGLLLLKQPEEIESQHGSTWVVGVDFGSSFTNVYYNNGTTSKRLELPALRHSVAGQDDGATRNILYEYFLSANKSEKILPLSTILTERGKSTKERHILDGRVYMAGDIVGFDPSPQHIKTNLKWSKGRTLTETFLYQLALQISAEAVRNHANKIQWMISYPSALGEDDQECYKSSWGDVLEKLITQTGIEHEWDSQDEKSWRTEGLAIAHYFNLKHQNTSTFICIDMGGTTSDISIWQEYTLLHQCSVRLAGKELFDRIVRQKPQALEILQRELLGDSGEDFVNLANNIENEAEIDPFSAKLAASLRQKSRKELMRKISRLENKSEKLTLEKTIQLTTVGIAGLYYYIGLLLRVLHSKTGNAVWNGTNLPDVYVGGNGSQIFHWLVPSGEFREDSRDANRLLREMLKKGSGFASSQPMSTILSQEPKDEVAYGLVLRQGDTNLIIPPDMDNRIIAGENYEFTTDGNVVQGEEGSRLKFTKNSVVTEFKIPELTNIKQFLADYHEAVEELSGNSIKPLPNYKNERWRDWLWYQTDKVMREVYLPQNMKGKSSEIRLEPPFIIGLKVMLKVLSNPKQPEDI